LGATACVDSAHKTLPVLTGGGYLHFSSSAKKFIDVEKVQNDLSLFSSSSPSYLIMASLDNANKILDSDFSKKLNKTVKEVEEVKNKLINLGVTIKNSEPLKIVIDAKKCGYTAFEINELLLKNGVVVEFYDEDYLTLMVSPYNKESDYKKLIKAFKNFTPKKEIEKEKFLFNAEKVLSPKKAYSLNKERVKVEDAKGKILADISYSCPPAVPIAIIGERVDENAIKALKYYKVKEIEVIKE
jgi:arginine/lysine/ornithine decarboxylase